MAFELPEDIRSLNDDELAATLEEARAAFAALSAENTIDDQGMTRMRALATGVQDIRQEQANRLQAAQQAATEIEQLAAQVRGDDPAAEPVEETLAEPTAAADPEPEPVVEAPVEPATATASLVARPALNLSNVRRHQPRVLPEPPAPTTSVTAAVDVPGYTPGSPLGFGEITAGIISRANALKTAGGGVGQVISYRHPYLEDLIVTDSSSAHGRAV
ncbi:major capsid protein [Streptomyces sp. NPDC057565]|uniref:major capsid protein n=1 Tax=Streptomyces sp. NPDC057565 TaxID=3346169 RepID=UPI0036B5905A